MGVLTIPSIALKAGRFGMAIAPFFIRFFFREKNVAIYIIIKKTAGKFEFLNLFHREWGCYLVPGVDVIKQNIDDESYESIHRAMYDKLGGEFSENISDEIVNSLVSKRIKEFDFWEFKKSGGDLSLKLYEYKFFLIKLDRTLSNSTDEYLSRPERNKWLSYDDMKNNRISYSKNKKIIDAIGEAMGKGYLIS